MADYLSSIAVQPFVIVPQPLRSCDAGFIIAPSELRSSESEIVNSIYDIYNREQVKSLYFVQIKPVLKNILVTTTVRSTLVDENTGRLGLKLTFGVAIHPAYMRRAQEDFLFCFEAISTCLCQVASTNVFYEATQTVLSIFQRDQDASVQIAGHEAFDWLLAKFQQKFWGTRNRTLSCHIAESFPNFLRFPELPRSQPLGDVEQVRSYWGYFGSVKPKEKDASLVQQPSKINISLADEIVRSGIIGRISDILAKLKFDSADIHNDPKSNVS